MKQSSSHLHWLDLFRFLAALIVVVSHVRAAVFVEYGMLAAESKTLFSALGFALTRISNEAVIMFFVLSGYLVGAKALVKMIEGRFKPVDYSVDRASRIFVPLLPALAFTALVAGVTGQGVNGLELLGNLFALQGVVVESFGNNEPLWSLSYEIWFYVLVLGVGLAVGRRRVNALPALIILATFAVFCVLLPSYLFCWLLGAVAFFWSPDRCKALWWSMAILLVLYGIAGIQIGSGSRSLADLSVARWLVSVEMSRLLLAAGFAIIVRLAVQSQPKHSVLRKLDTMGTALATSSYTLYLTHFPFLHLLAYFGLERYDTVSGMSIGVFAAVTCACVLFAYVMYWLFERHTLVLRDALKRKWARYA